MQRSAFHKCLKPKILSFFELSANDVLAIPKKERLIYKRGHPDLAVVQLIVLLWKKNHGEELPRFLQAIAYLGAMSYSFVRFEVIRYNGERFSQVYTRYQSFVSESVDLIESINSGANWDKENLLSEM